MTTSANEPTERQYEVLEFIEGFLAINHYAPSTREIAEHFGFTQTGAVNHINALERKGKISRIAGKARTITIL